MARSTLVRHRNRVILRDPDEGGGGGNPGGAGTEGGAPQGGQGTGGTGNTDPPATKSATGEALDPDTGKGLGFPAETPVERMSEGERTAYWRNQTKVQQKVADSRKDYDQQKADAEKWRAQQQSQMTPSEQAIAAAKLEAKKEAAVENADALVRGILASRGKAEVDINGLLEFVSPDRFVTADGKVDHQKVNAYANSVAPTSSSGGGNGYGQGRYEQTVQSRSAEGKAEAERRFGTKK